MNELILIYNHMSETKRLYEKYTRIGKDNLGNKFSFISTNARGILPEKGQKYGGFYQAFKIIKDVESIPRDQWSRTNRVGQETEKQHTVKMRESEFFMVRNNAFKITSRGIVFEKMIESPELTSNEKRFLCYLLIMSAYFSKTPNYIVKRTEQIFDAFEKQGVSCKEVFDSIQEIVAASLVDGFSKKDIFLYDYTYYDSFTFDYDNIGFLKHFHNSNVEVKEEFKRYIYNQDDVETTQASILKKKFESGGNYTVTSLIDNAWMLYVTKNIINLADKITSFETFIDVAIKSYNELFQTNTSAVRKFIFDTDKNKSVFIVIYSQVFGIPVIKYEVEKDLTQEEIKNLGIIDSTDELGRLTSEQVVISLKRLAKSQSNYICECDELEGCKYFTSKDNNKNFLEIHHLIPREFANDFDDTIEVLSNYVALCPNCHRKIHHALDREREHLLRSFLAKRKEALLKDGLQINIKELFEYYGFDKP